MSTSTKTPAAAVSREQMLGTEMRWRRFGEPTPAGMSTGPDGKPDYGLFGPGSMVWEVLLHPATIVLETSAQGFAQTKCYKPIVAGLRDRDPMSRKARQGTVTFLDVHDRTARNSGMHAPMWLADGETAGRMWKHLHNIHRKVEGELIDIGKPELGGYAASAPRDAMWAALTEMHPILRAYEAFAFRDGHGPRKLTDAQRDQYIREVGAYLRLVEAPEEDIPTSMAELDALYEKYADLFAPSRTVEIMPDTGQNYMKLILSTCMKNFHITHLRMVPSLLLAFALELPMAGAMSAKARRSAGMSKLAGAAAVTARRLFVPIAWILQRPRIERSVQRLMWGPDAVTLIAHARRLHAEAKAARPA